MTKSFDEEPRGAREPARQLIVLAALQQLLATRGVGPPHVGQHEHVVDALEQLALDAEAIADEALAIAATLRDAAAQADVFSWRGPP